MIVVLMGVSGSGKTTIGTLLAQRMQAHFVDADDYHSDSNIELMRQGLPLDDEDRGPWLTRLNEVLQAAEERGESVVLACSALKEEYRDLLLKGIADARLVYLRGSESLIASRLSTREGHYMNPQLLASQFATLEEPRGAIIADVTGTPEGITQNIYAALTA